MKRLKTLDIDAIEPDRQICASVQGMLSNTRQPPSAARAGRSTRWGGLFAWDGPC